MYFIEMKATNTNKREREINLNLKHYGNQFIKV